MKRVNNVTARSFILIIFIILDKYKSIILLVDMKRNHFSTDPSFMGAYSYQIPGVYEGDYRALEHPIHQSLYFAGEAYQREEFGFTHGAYESGHKAAINITKCMNNEDNCLPDNPILVDKTDSCSSASSNGFSRSLPWIYFVVFIFVSFY